MSFILITIFMMRAFVHYTCIHVQDDEVLSEQEKGLRSLRLTTCGGARYNTIAYYLKTVLWHSR